MYVFQQQIITEDAKRILNNRQNEYNLSPEGDTQYLTRGPIDREGRKGGRKGGITFRCFKSAKN